MDLPSGVRPRLSPWSPTGEIVRYVLEGPGYTLNQLKAVQDWVLKPQLRSVPGVAELNSWGGFEKQYQVEVDPSRLAKHGLTLNDVEEALRKNNLNVGGGTLEESGEAHVLKGVGIEILWPQLLAMLVFATVLVGVATSRFRRTLA